MTNEGLNTSTDHVAHSPTLRQAEKHDLTSAPPRAAGARRHLQSLRRDGSHGLEGDR